MDFVPEVPPCDSLKNDVLPPYECYMSDPGSEWKAKSVAYAVGHFIEWVYEYYAHHDQQRLEGAGSLSAFRHILFAKSPDLKIVFDVAEAAKHRFLKFRPESRVVSTSSDTFVVGPILYVAACDRDFAEVVRAAVVFWQRWLGCEDVGHM